MLTDLVHVARIAGTYVTGRLAVCLGVGTAASAGLIGGALVPFFSVPLGAFIMSYISKINQQNRDEDILLFYRDEVAALVKKEPKHVTLGDLERVAKGDAARGIAPNPVIAEAVERHQKERNVGIGVHATAAAVTLLGVAAVALLASPAGWVLAVGAAASCGLLDITLDQVSERYFSLNQPTLHDRIARLSQHHAQGHCISESQVMGLYASARPDLAHAVMQRFGKKYDALAPEQKAVALLEFGQKYRIAEITQDFNTGQMHVGELAFTLAGQHSGVPRLAEPPQSLIDKACHASQKMLETGRQKFGEHAHALHEKWRQHLEARKAHAEDGAAQSFADRVGGPKGETALLAAAAPVAASHQEQILQRRETVATSATAQRA